MITKKSFGVENTWINLNTDSRAELRTLYKNYGIDSEVIDYTLDKNERAHLDYDQITKTLVVIFNVPNSEKIDNHYETLPMTFIVKDNQLITVTNEKNHYVFQEMANYLDKFPDSTLFSFLFSSLFLITDLFFPYIEEMDEGRISVNHKLKEKTSKQNLLLLSDLEIGIVYLVAASKQNTVLLEQIRSHAVYKSLSPSEKEQLEDVVIEARQLVEMTTLSAQILQQLSGTYNNVLNNSLNETMRILTVLSVLLTIPTIITGFFGMNMPLPLENNTSGWLITIAMSTIIWFVLSWILRKFMK
jgi:Mg2+ and Co2+ transporter CorA